jgi:hypothetical protein
MLRHKARASSAPGSEAGKTHVTICVKRIQLGISCIALLVQKRDVSPPGGNSLSCSTKPTGERIALLERAEPQNQLNASRGRGPESDVAADYGNAPTFSDTLVEVVKVMPSAAD